MYAREEVLYRAVRHRDRYYKGKMKTVFIHKPIDPTAAAVRASFWGPCPPATAAGVAPAKSRWCRFLGLWCSS